jgi:fatty-acyl-CoA synthase
MYYNDWLTKRELYTPQKEAVIDVRANRRYTYRMLNKRANRLAAYLQREYGLEAADRVAVVSKNSVEYMLLFFACAKLGAVLVPLNYRLSADALSELIADCDPRLLVYSGEFEKVRDHSVSGSVDQLSLDKGNESVAEIVESGSGKPTIYKAGADEIAMILYTSGTTGKAKGAMIPWRQIHWNSVNTAIGLGLTGRDSSFVNTPFYHTGGWHVLLTPLLHRGGKLVFQPGFDASECNRLIEKEQISILFGIPTMLRMMMEQPDFEVADFSSLRFVICGGESCPIPVIKRYRQKGVQIRQGYGLTEAGPNCYSLPAEDAIRKQGSVGFPNFHVGVKIVDDENEIVNRCEVGELLMKGPHVFEGYLNNQQATREVFENGWLHTGDLFRCDEDGYYYMAGRKNDMYISGGENVYPVQVEKVLYDHPSVAQAAVIGVPDENWGETGCAFIVLHNNDSLSAEEVKDYCREKLAGYQCPKYVNFRDDLPVGDSNKIQKTILKTEYNQL